MKLLLRRDQKSGLTGKVTFTLNVRAEVSDQELQHLQKYKLGKTVLFTNYEMVDPGAGLLGLASRMAAKALNITVTVDDLVKGKQVDCKDIVEMLAAEEQIRVAAEQFKSVLDAAAHFGGEEVIEL